MGATRRLGMVSLVALASTLFAACGTDSVSTEYITADSSVLLEFGEGWNIYEQAELGDLTPFVHPVQNITLAPENVVAFDEAPSRDVGNLDMDIAASPFPIGAASVRSIGAAQRDFVSPFLLTQSVLPYRQYAEPRELVNEDFSFGDGYDGTRRLVQYTSADGQSIGVAYLITVTNPTDERMYSVIAGCSSDCFTQNQTDIEQVVDSWLVNTKG